MEVGCDKLQTRRQVEATFWRLSIKATHQRNLGKHTKAKEAQGMSMRFLCYPLSTTLLQVPPGTKASKR